MPGLEHDHDRASIRRRFASGPPVSYLRDWVYGGIDGAVTTFAVVAAIENPSPMRLAAPKTSTTREGRSAPTTRGWR
jgi:hypothetical protein